MTGRILFAAALVFGLLAVALLAAYVRALILAATRPGRHELGELQQPSEADVDEFLEALPPWEQAPRAAVYADHSMLPLPSPDAGPPVVASITDAPDRRHGRAERLATDTDVRATVTCACGLPAGHFADALLTGSLDFIGRAFDTSQFPAVTA